MTGVKYTLCGVQDILYSFQGTGIADTLKK